MKIFIIILEIAAILLYGMSGVMKAFMFDKASDGVKSFGALPKTVWQVLGLLELVCVTGFILTLTTSQLPVLVSTLAFILAAESLVFIYVHTRYNERSALILSAALGVIMLAIGIGKLAVH